MLENVVNQVTGRGEEGLGKKFPEAFETKCQKL